MYMRFRRVIYNVIARDWEKLTFTPFPSNFRIVVQKFGELSQNVKNCTIIWQYLRFAPSPSHTIFLFNMSAHEENKIEISKECAIYFWLLYVFTFDLV